MNKKALATVVGVPVLALGVGLWSLGGSDEESSLPSAEVKAPQPKAGSNETLKKIAEALPNAVQVMQPSEPAHVAQALPVPEKNEVAAPDGAMREELRLQKMIEREKRRLARLEKIRNKNPERYERRMQRLQEAEDRRMKKIESYKESNPEKYEKKMREAKLRRIARERALHGG